MVKLKTLKLQDKSESELEVSDKIFNAKQPDELVHFVLKTYLHNKMQKNSKVKNRSAVSGGGAKPYNQKGTGRARQGTTRSPLKVGGGVIFGPQGVKRDLKINKKIRRKALLSVLTDKAKQTVVLQGDDKFNDSVKKVKDFTSVIKALELVNKKILYVSAEKNSRERVLGNISKLKICSVYGLNVYDLLYSQGVIIDERSVKQLEEIYKNG